MLKPLKQWICDFCEIIINSPEDGWVEWLHGKEIFNSCFGFKIVHNYGSSSLGKGGCFHYRDEKCSSDAPLIRFIGEKGYVYLLSFLDLDPYVIPEYKGPCVKDIREFIEFMRRLTIPYYEEARLYFKKLHADDISIYHQEELKKIIQAYGEK